MSRDVGPARTDRGDGKTGVEIVSYLVWCVGLRVTRSAVPRTVCFRLVGKIIERFEQRGYKLAAMKLKQPSEELLKQHYKDLVEKPFFPKMLGYMLSGPVVCMVWEGKNVVKMGRQMLGATNPMESMPGTIRGDFSLDVGRNICHGSDSVESAEVR